MQWHQGIYLSMSRWVIQPLLQNSQKRYVNDFIIQHNHGNDLGHILVVVVVVSMIINNHNCLLTRGIIVSELKHMVTLQLINKLLKQRMGKKGALGRFSQSRGMFWKG